MFPAIILIRILFIACMVFVIGYVFGNFSRRKTLATISKVATILAIVLFIATNAVLLRFGGGHGGWCGPHNNWHTVQKDTTVSR